MDKKPHRQSEPAPSTPDVRAASDATDAAASAQPLSLEQSLRWHQAIADLTSDFATTARVLKDGTIRIERVTAGFFQVTGYTLEQLEAAGGWAAIIHEEDLARTSESVRRMLEGNDESQEIRIVTRQGETRWLRYLGRPEFDPGGQRVAWIHTAGQDITAEKRALQELQGQRQWLRTTLSSIGDAVVTTNHQGRITFANPVAEKLIGVAHEDTLRRPLGELFHVADESTGELIELDIPRFLEAGRWEGASPSTQLRLQSGSEWLSIHCNVTPLNDPAGNVSGAVLIFRDVTAQRQTERSVSVSEARKTAILEASLDAIVSIDHEGRIIEFNPAAERTFGYRHEAVMGKSMAELLVPPSLRKQHYQGLARFLETGEGPVLNRRIELPALRSDGSEFPVEIAITPFETGGPPGFTAHIRDISEQKRYEQRRNARLAVTQVLADIEIISEAAPRILQAVCESLHWDVGAYWVVHRQTMRCAHIWQSPSLDGEAFREATREAAFQIGEGLPGRVYGSRQPVWVTDVTQDRNFPRAKVALECGLRSAFASPIYVGDEFLGVIEFFSRSAQAPDDDLLELMSTVGGQIGQFLKRKQAERKGHESEEQLRLALAAAGLGTWRVDLSTGELQASPIVRGIYGLTADESLTHEQRIAAIHPEDREAARQQIARAVQNGGDYEAEYRVVRRDESIRWIVDAGQVIVDDEQRATSIQGVCLDISDRKRNALRDRYLAEAGSAFVASLDFRQILQQVAELSVPFLGQVCFFDIFVDGQLERVAWKCINQEPEIDEQLVQFLPARTNDLHPINLALESGRPILVPQVTETWLDEIAPKQEHREFLGRLAPQSLISIPLMVGDERLGVFTTVYTQAPRRYSEDDLRLAEEIGRRVALTVQNARLISELTDADRRKDEFLAMLGHELRNPLAPIRSGLDMLALDRPNEVVQLMRQQLEHLIRLVDDLLDVSRIMRGRIELRRTQVDVREIVERALDTVRVLVDQRQLELDVSLPDEPIVLDADPVRLAQVLVNLLNNSAKYTEPEGRIQLTVRRRRQTAILQVVDTGIGIEAGLLSKVFDLFTQSERSIDRSQGGLGIGLTIVRNLVQMHGGTIAAHSDGPGSGTTFTIRLPISDELRSDAVSDEPAAEAAAARILVVDDNVGAAQMLRLLLERLGQPLVRSAHDGQQALDAAVEFQPQLVLLDLGLPKMDGFEVARRLRQMPALKDVLIVALTGYGSEEDRRRSAAAGFDEHLVKPPSVTDLQRLLAHDKLNGNSAD